jgi:hypothetical protein
VNKERRHSNQTSCLTACFLYDLLAVDQSINLKVIIIFVIISTYASCHSIPARPLAKSQWHLATVGIQHSFYPTYSLFDLSPPSDTQELDPMRTVHVLDSLTTILTIFQRDRGIYCTVKLSLPHLSYHSV